MPDPGSPAAAPKRRALFSGLDLGKNADYSVLATVERFKLAKPVAKRRYRYELVWLEAWELGTRYTALAPGQRSVIGDVKSLFDRPALSKTCLACDYTGVGMPVFEQLQAAKVNARLNPVLITSGHNVQTPRETKDGSWPVPKVELAGVLIVLLAHGLLKWVEPGKPGALKFAARLEKELTAFREFLTKKKNRTFGAEASQHDDFVLALGLAVWLAEHLYGGSADEIAVGGASAESTPSGSVLEQMPAGASPAGNAIKRFE